MTIVGNDTAIRALVAVGAIDIGTNLIATDSAAETISSLTITKQRVISSNSSINRTLSELMRILLKISTFRLKLKITSSKIQTSFQISKTSLTDRITI